MKTPFSPHFDRASIGLTRVAVPSFVPLYPMPFVPQADWINLVGEGVALIYRECDGFDVFVAELEAWFTGETVVPLGMPVESLLHDLHLVYQLAGTTAFPALAMLSGQHTEIYAPPSQAELTIQADSASGRYAACAVVPKGKWLARGIHHPSNPLAGLIRCLEEKHGQFRCLAPAAMTPQVRMWIQLLLTTPPYPHLLMDNALNHALGNLLDVHLRECDKHQQRSTADEKNKALVAAARMMARELLGRLREGKLPELAYIAQRLGTEPGIIRKLHLDIHGQKFSLYVIHCRIEEAQRRLLLGDSIASVTYALGWTDESAFTKQFKKHTGVTPGSFIKTHKPRL